MRRLWPRIGQWFGAWPTKGTGGLLKETARRPGRVGSAAGREPFHRGGGYKNRGGNAEVEADAVAEELCHRTHRLFHRPEGPEHREQRQQEGEPGALVFPDQRHRDTHDRQQHEQLDPAAATGLAQLGGEIPERAALLDAEHLHRDEREEERTDQEDAEPDEQRLAVTCDDRGTGDGAGLRGLAHGTSFRGEGPTPAVRKPAARTVTPAGAAASESSAAPHGGSAGRTPRSVGAARAPRSRSPRC